ncbi:MAG: class I SAM-dependent methyltransferase [Leptolyngbyaceae bacterium]|nr:class I SAM-dependent methyltransferase [Leptolyngbyaceae bacterium]
MRAILGKIQKKLGTAVYYLLHPSTYPFLWRFLKTKIFGGSLSLDDTREESTRWCHKQAVDTSEAIQEITGLPNSLVSIRHVFREIFDQAEMRVAACPQKMGGAGNLDLLYVIAQRLGAKRVIETGVAYGWSSLAILLAISTHSEAKLVSTNLHYSQYNDDSYVGCAVPDELRSCWTIIREADLTALPKALSMLPEYDLCHYDSNKNHAGRIWAYPLLWRALRVGGYFISDDVGDNLAFAHFCRMVRHKPLIVKIPSSTGDKFVGILLKTDNLQPRDIMF